MEGKLEALDIRTSASKERGVEMPTMSSRYQRYTDCQDALDESLQRFVEQAKSEGWNCHEIATALVNFAVDLVPDARSAASEHPLPPNPLAH